MVAGGFQPQFEDSVTYDLRGQRDYLMLTWNAPGKQDTYGNWSWSKADVVVQHALRRKAQHHHWEKLPFAERGYLSKIGS